MAVEGQIVNSILSAIGIAPEDFAADRQRVDEDYARIVGGLEKGFTIKEQGQDAKSFEDRFGPYRAAALLGAEKTNAFRAVQQAQQQRTQLQQAIGSWLNQPTTMAVPGVTREEAEGFYPRLQGPGIEAGAQIGAANLGNPQYEDYAQRIAEMPAEVKAMYFGPEVSTAGHNERELAFRAGPDFELRQRQVGQAETGLALEGARLDQQKFEYDTTLGESRRARVADATKTVMAWNSTLTTAEARLVGRVHAGQAPENILKKRKRKDGTLLADVVGVTKGTGGQNMRPLYDRMNKLADWPKEFVADPKRRKDLRSYDAAELDAQNNANLVEYALAAANYYSAAGLTDPQKLLAEIEQRARVLLPDGNAVSLADLDKTQYNAKMNVIMRALGGGASAGAPDPVVEEWKRKTLGGGGAAPTASVPAAAIVGPTTTAATNMLTQLQAGTAEQRAALVQQEQARLRAGGRADKNVTRYLQQIGGKQAYPAYFEQVLETVRQRARGVNR